MTLPLFAKTVLEPNVMATLIQIPNNVSFATGTLNICNTGSTAAKVRIGFGGGATMVLVDTVDHASIVPPEGGLLIRSCSLAKPGDNVFVMADQPGVVVNFTALCQPLVV